MLVRRSVERFAHPFPSWFTESERWYEELLWALWYVVVAGSLVIYDLRRVRRAGVKTGQRWREKVELRVVLYFSAVVLMAGVPIAVLKYVEATHGDPPAFKSSFGSLFPWGYLLYAALGTGLVSYDRRRMRREAKEDAGHRCINCGYDLRATADRCPECGTLSPGV